LLSAAYTAPPVTFNRASIRVVADPMGEPLMT
jgi:hypothetical protein